MQVRTASERYVPDPERVRWGRDVRGEPGVRDEDASVVQRVADCAADSVTQDAGRARGVRSGAGQHELCEQLRGPARAQGCCQGELGQLVSSSSRGE